MDDTLNTLLGLPADIPTVDAEVVVETPPAPPLPVPDPHVDDLNTDVTYVREQMKQLIDDGRSALNGIMELAAAGEESRPYEIVAELIQSITNANKELINIHKVRKEALKTGQEAKVVPAPGSPGNVTIDKAVFVGTASDLLRELQKARRQTAAELIDP
jgi:hypothetical protein